MPDLQTMRSLKTLHLLASWDMGDAALALAGRLDMRREAQAHVEQLEGVSAALHQVYAQATDARRSLNVASLHVLGRQARMAGEAGRQAAETMAQADSAVRWAQDVLAERRCREDALRAATEQQRRALSRAREARAQASLDDLMMMRHARMERP